MLLPESPSSWAFNGKELGWFEAGSGMNTALIQATPGKVYSSTHQCYRKEGNFLLLEASSTSPHLSKNRGFDISAMKKWVTKYITGCLFNISLEMSASIWEKKETRRLERKDGLPVTHFTGTAQSLFIPMAFGSMATKTSCKPLGLWMWLFHFPKERKC